MTTSTRDSARDAEDRLESQALRPGLRAFGLLKSLKVEIAPTVLKGAVPTGEQLPQFRVAASRSMSPERGRSPSSFLTTCRTSP